MSSDTMELREQAASEGAEPDPAAVGVLFVHGIGTQTRGRTLAEFANPIVTWLTSWYEAHHDLWADAGLHFDDVEEWLESRVGDDPRLLDAVRSLLDRLPKRPSATAPVDIAALSERVGDVLAVAVRLVECRTGGHEPHSVLLETTSVSVDGSLRRTSWILAESWWADVFGVPSFGDLARWGVGIITRTIGSHFGVRVQRAVQAVGRGRSRGRVLGVAVALAQLFAALYVSLLALVGLGLLLLLSIAPVPRLKAGITRLQQRLAASLGDSYVLVTQPVQAAAIVSRTRADLAWVASRADKVVVMAHSQGAAVVNEVLRLELAQPGREQRESPRSEAASQRPGSGSLHLLLTFGSGLRKLDELRRLVGPERHFRRSALLTLVGIVLFTLGTLSLAAWQRLEGDGELVWGIPYALVGVALLAAGMSDMISGAEASELEWWVQRLQQRGIAWTDYAASADPVPNGRLLPVRAGFPEHRTVYNRQSLLRDHNTYWSNLDEFVADVVGRLARLDPLLAGDLEEFEPLFSFAQRRRRWRIAWLTGIRWFAVAGVLLILTRTRDVWLPHLAWVGQRIMSWAGAGSDGAGLDPQQLLRAFWPVAVLLVVYGAAATAWRLWNEHEVRQVLARVYPGSGTADSAFAAVVSFLAPIAVVVAVPGGSWDSPWQFFGVFVGLMVVWFWTQVRLRVFAPAAPQAPARKRTRAEAVGQHTWSLLTLGAMFIGFVILGTTLWRWVSNSRIALAIVGAAVLLASLAVGTGLARRRNRGG